MRYTKTDFLWRDSSLSARISVKPGELPGLFEACQE